MDPLHELRLILLNACSDAEIVEFWHGQSNFGGHNGLCQETCRDLGHTQMGIATLGNVAETAHHQGLDLWGENKGRLGSFNPFCSYFKILVKTSGCRHFTDVVVFVF